MRLFSKLWHSATFTSWLNWGVQSLRLIAVTPLILTRLSKAEIAAWYLFATLTFFGEVLISRTGTTFWRMIALAMGGANDLSPVQPGEGPRGNGKPNWEMVERVYGTLAILQTGLGIFGGLLTLGLGLFSLPNITSHAEKPQLIWFSFAAFVATSTVSFVFRRYSIFLYGTNHVALDNRWTAIFSLLSVVVGYICLWLYPNILLLAVAMQIMTLLNILRGRHFALTIERGRAKTFRAFQFDRKIISWAWKPFWQGLIVQLADVGSIQCGAVLFSRFGKLEEVSAYLFTLRIVQALTQVASAPFTSKMPLFTKMVSAGDIDRLREMIIQRTVVCLLLLCAGFIFLCSFGHFTLNLIGAHTQLISLPLLMAMWLCIAHQLHVNFAWSVAGAGNLMPCVSENAVSFVLSVILVASLCSTYGTIAVIMASWLPRLLLVNRQPYALGAVMLNCSPLTLFRRTYTAVLVSWVATLIILIWRAIH